MKLFNAKYMVTAIIVVSLLFQSCSKDRLQKDPTAAIPPATIFATVDNSWTAINGVYKFLYSQWYSSQALGGQSGNIIYMEVLAEDFVMPEQSNGWFISEYRWLQHRSATSTIVRFNYQYFYSIIANCNAIIQNVDNATGATIDKDNIKGQAYAMRAWSYFYMVRLFGERYKPGGDNSSMGVPLVLAPTTVASPRSTIEEVYTQINLDLEQAAGLLQGKTRKHISHINLATVNGFRARVALEQGKWALAATYAASARQGTSLMNQAQLMAGLSDRNNPESIWAIEHRTDQTTFFYSYYAYLGNFSSTNSRNNPKCIFSPLYNRMSVTDYRRRWWDPTGADPTFTITDGGIRRPYMTQKFKLANPANSNGDMMFLRTAEMYLVEAEALARDEKYTQAQDALYAFAITRDPAYVKSTSTGAALIEEILVQRRIELWGEGFRFYDLKRLNLPLDRTGGNHNGTVAQKLTEPAGTLLWQFLIPEAEIRLTNNVVVQNPL